MIWNGLVSAACHDNFDHWGFIKSPHRLGQIVGHEADQVLEDGTKSHTFARLVLRVTTTKALSILEAPSVCAERLVRRAQTETSHRASHPYMCSSGSLLPELLGKPDENSFWAPDVAEPIRIFVLDHFADELRAAFAEPGERIVDILHGEHDA